MSLDRRIACVMAAMIFAIIAYVTPSAVEAHEGHAHHGHYMATAQPTVVPSTAKAAVAPAKPAIRAEAPVWSKVALAAVEAARIEPAGENCCRPGCKTRCCGTMACCATGVLSEPYSLAPSLFRIVTLIPRDVAGRTGIGPEALPEPPRTLA